MQKNTKTIKNDLRTQYKVKRALYSVDEKALLDEKISSKILNLTTYRNAETVLCYVSTTDEINTHFLIEQMIANGKKVAVPRCIPDTHEMEFYYISSLSDLSKGAFSILEPLPEKSKLFCKDSSVICLIPALSFDIYGYRLGYGKGYYDRFLSGFDGVKLGLSYYENITQALPHGRFDCRVDSIVTECRIVVTKPEN